MSTKSSLYSFWKFLAILGIGLLGGAISGSLILSFGYFIGRGGDTPPAPFGTLALSIMMLGAIYGALLGAFAVPIAYLVKVRRIGWKRSILPAFAGTLIGGFFGAIAGPPFAVVTGIIGFCAGLGFVRARQ